MKILAILGGTLGSCDLVRAYAKVVPKLLQQGLENKTTPFADHEIIVVLAEEAIDAYFKQLPDRIIFIGTYSEAGGKTSDFILAQRMLTRNMDKRKFLFTNPIHVPPFGNDENFFVVTETDEMAGWLGLI